MIVTAAAAFRAALPNGGRLLGLDVGTKTIGLATCDDRWTFASPQHTLTRTRFTADAAQLRVNADQNSIVGAVLGLPLSMDGSDSPRTQSVRAFARQLQPLLAMPLLLWDERWSTVAVERAMIAADLSRAKRAARVDALAAAHILQAAIDALMHGG